MASAGSVVAQTSILPTGSYTSTDGNVSITAQGVPYENPNVVVSRPTGVFTLVLGSDGWYVNGNEPTRRASFFQVNGVWYYSFDKKVGGVWVDDGWGPLS